MLRSALIESKERAILPSGGPVNSVVFSRDGRFVLTASDDRSARIWSLHGPAPARVLRHEGPVHTAAFSPDGALVVTASEDGTARIWLTASGSASADAARHESGDDCVVQPRRNARPDNC